MQTVSFTANRLLAQSHLTFLHSLRHNISVFTINVLDAGVKMIYVRPHASESLYAKTIMHCNYLIQM